MVNDICEINTDWCANCGAEHGYMCGPCEKCGGTTFTKKRNSNMKAKLIVAYANNIWTDHLIEVPDGVVPDKYHRGSTKWNRTVIKWATDNVDLEDGKEIEFVGMLDANPEE